MRCGCILGQTLSDMAMLTFAVRVQTISLDEDDNDDDGPFREYNIEEYGTPLPDNFDAFDSARPAVSNPPPDLLRQKEFYLTPMTLTEAILSVCIPCAGGTSSPITLSNSC